MEGRVGGAKTTAKNSSTPTQSLRKPLKKLNNPDCNKATMSHMSLHLWVWLLIGQTKTAKLMVINFVKFFI